MQKQSKKQSNKLMEATVLRTFETHARGPQRKIFEFGVSVLWHAVIYETHSFFVIIVFW